MIYKTNLFLPLVFAVGAASGCGRFDGHQQRTSQSATNLSNPSPQCTAPSDAGSPWKDKLATDKEVADLRAKRCNDQADSLAAKQRTYSIQSGLKEQSAAVVEQDHCLAQTKKFAGYFPGALASLQIDFDDCLAHAESSAAGQTCIESFKTGAAHHHNLADQMAGCPQS